MSPHSTRRPNRRPPASAVLLPLLSLLALLTLPLSTAAPAHSAVPERTVAPEGAAVRASGEVNVIASHSGRCVAVEHNSSTAGALVRQADCTGQPGAVWTLQQSSAGGGSVNIVNAHSGRCLYVPNPDNGTVAQQANCTGQGASFQVVDKVTHVWLQPLGSNPAKCLAVGGGTHTPGMTLRVAACAGVGGTAFHQRQPTTGNDPATTDPDPANCPKGSFCVYSGPNQTGTLQVAAAQNWSGQALFGSVFNNGWVDPNRDHIQLSYRAPGGATQSMCLHYHPGPGDYQWNAPDGTYTALSATWRGEC